MELSDAEIHALQVKPDHEAVLAAVSDLTQARLDAAHRGVMKGISLHLTGQTGEAMPFLVLSTLDPVQASATTPEFRQDIAMALLLLGQTEKAIVLLEELVMEDVADAVVYGRLATAKLLINDTDGALEYFREAVKREAGRVEWHSNLGGVLVRQQRLEEALENYDVALRLDPDFQKAKKARESVLMALGRGEDVIRGIEADLKKEPNKTSLRIALARALVRENRVVEALSTLTEALLPPEEVPGPELDAEDIRDQSSDADQEVENDISSRKGQFALRAAIAEASIELDMHLRALAALNELLMLEPENPVPYIRQRISVLLELNRPEDAEEALLAAEEKHGDVTALRMARAQYYTETGQHEKAEALQRELIETYPGDVPLMLQLGQSLMWNGKLDEAAALYEQAAETNPMALAQMVNAKHMPDDPMILEKMRSVADNPFVPSEQRVTMSFALAEVYDKQKDYDTAFRYLDQANTLSDKTLNYNPDAFSQTVNRTIEFFTPAFFQSQEPIRPTARVPVFVVGMPRSGTTLTEQILCSHPEVFGAGELGTISRIMTLFPKVIKSGQRYPQCLLNATVDTREKAARFYLRALDALDADHSYVVDKMPHNFMHLGLISLILPRAKIIHIRRDPRDTALSNYQQNFKAKHGGMGYSFNLQKMARQFNDYHRMMEHWRQVLPVPMFELTYEELVADQEGMTRALLDFVGVEWSDEVRDFHKTERAVRTASVAQVRQKIYQTSKQKWRHYEQHLTPLLEDLNPEVTALWDQGVEPMTEMEKG
jgi:tetratricopeptide (TPR) repeat protein